MPSPFPGMNPYLERAEVWQDFHDSFLPFVREALTAQIHPRYYVKIEEHLFIREPPAAERFTVVHADLAIGAKPAPLAPIPTATATAVAPASVGMPAETQVTRIPYLEIRDRKTRDVVTVLELLSPANKYAGPDREAYFDKVQKILRTRTHFIEIDLLRGGPRMPWSGLPSCDYYVVVSRHQDRMKEGPRADLWPLGLRDRLPPIPVPLRPDETEPTLDLQAVLHRVYDTAGYDLFIYDGLPEPHLSPDDAAWAEHLSLPRSG